MVSSDYSIIRAHFRCLMLMQTAHLYTRWIRFLPLLAIVIPLCTMAQTPLPQQTLSYPEDIVNDPLLYEPPVPDSKMDIGSIGCLVGTVATSAGMLYLMGGVGPVLTSISPPLRPAVVLESSAAVAFVLSSVCYLGVTLAPLVLDAYAAIAESVDAPNRPLFAAGELQAIMEGVGVP